MKDARVFLFGVLALLGGIITGLVTSTLNLGEWTLMPVLVAWCLVAYILSRIVPEKLLKMLHLS